MIPSIVLVIIFAFAGNGGITYEKSDNFGDCSILLYDYDSCIRANHIIKQNDWLICSELHKGTRIYEYDYKWESETTALESTDLIRICGEIP
jgi:hypothetical protein